MQLFTDDVFLRTAQVQRSGSLLQPDQSRFQYRIRRFRHGCNVTSLPGPQVNQSDKNPLIH